MSYESFASTVHEISMAFASVPPWPTLIRSDVALRISDHSSATQPFNRNFSFSRDLSIKSTFCSSRFSRRNGKHRLSSLLPEIEASTNSNDAGSVLQASSMEEVYDKLASRLLSATTAAPPSCKLIVGLAGPPGGGKSTVANEVVKRMNASWHEMKSSEDCSSLHDIAISLPMDGFHLYRWQLDTLEDPVEAHARRGAPWTFDPAGLVKCLTSLRSQGWVSAPSFDHGVGDPIENDIFVRPWHKVILVEGNYLFLEDNKWKDLAAYFDERWFVDIDIDKAMKRVEKRHIMTGKSPEEAKYRVEYNDRRNAELVVTSKVFADLIIQSVDIEG